MNRVVLMGHLGADPRSGATTNGKRVTSFNIATNEFIKTSEGEKEKRTDWHKVTTWGKTAEACEKMLQKGSFVLVEGKIRNTVNKEGAGPNYEVFATDISFISNYGRDKSPNEEEDKLEDSGLQGLELNKEDERPNLDNTEASRAEPKIEKKKQRIK
jgi:single-strand DNA-binding protein